MYPLPTHCLPLVVDSPNVDVVESATALNNRHLNSVDFHAFRNRIP